MPMLSSLITTSETADILKAHARFADGVLKRRLDVGMEPDELRELASDLWTLHDEFAEYQGTDEPEADGDDELLVDD